MRPIRAASPIMAYANAAAAALATRVDLDVVVTAKVISGQPAGLAALPAFPFQITLSLDDGR